MPINFNILNDVVGGAQRGEIAAAEDQREQGLLARQFMLQQEQDAARENQENAEAQYYQGRNAARAKELADKMSAAQAAQKAKQDQDAAMLSERIRHNKALEGTAQSRVDAERLFHQLALKGDPLQKQVQDFVKQRYSELLKSPGKDITGNPLPAMAAGDAAAQARAEAKAMYGNVTDQIIPPAAAPATKAPATPTMNPASVSAYQQHLQQAMALHQRAIDSGVPVPQADAALAASNLNLHKLYGLPTGDAPQTSVANPAPQPSTLTPATALKPAATPTTKPVTPSVTTSYLPPSPDDAPDEDSQ